MRKISVFTKEQQDAVKPSTNISVFLNKEKFNDYVAEWDIANITTEKNSTQTKMSTNNKVDLENIYPLFY